MYLSRIIRYDLLSISNCECPIMGAIVNVKMVIKARDMILSN